jgi:hypothetical protein
VSLHHAGLCHSEKCFRNSRVKAATDPFKRQAEITISARGNSRRTSLNQRQAVNRSAVLSVYSGCRHIEVQGRLDHGIPNIVTSHLNENGEFMQQPFITFSPACVFGVKFTKRVNLFPVVWVPGSRHTMYFLLRPMARRWTTESTIFELDQRLLLIQSLSQRHSVHGAPSSCSLAQTQRDSEL